MIEAFCVIFWYTIKPKIRVKWFQTNTLRVERECGFALGNRWISALSRPRSAGAAECAQIKLDCKGLNIHQGPRYCQQNCPILFMFDSKHCCWGCVLGITYFVVVNSARTRNKINSLNLMIETALENDKDLVHPFPKGLPASKKKIYTYTSLNTKTCNCNVPPFVLFLLHGDTA